MDADSINLESVVSEEVMSTALVLQRTVAIEKITDAVTFGQVNAAGTDAATNIKNITAQFEDIVTERYNRWKKATTKRAEKLAPFEQVKKKASSLIGSYNQEQEAIRRAEEARLNRLEQERVARENEELRKQREKAAEEQALQDAIALEAAGNTEAAEAVLNYPVPIEAAPVVIAAPIFLPSTAPKINDGSKSTTWKWRVRASEKCNNLTEHDPTECPLCLEAVPRKYLILNSTMVGKLVRGSKNLTDIPGIEVYPDSGARFKV